MLEERHAIWLLAYLVILFSIVVHECAHGIMAYWCGDDTAYRMGRITLNPIPHIDPVMSILMPAILLYIGGPVFGGARPVPVVIHNLRNPRRDMIWVAWAGPMSNILLAVAFALAGNLLLLIRPDSATIAADPEGQWVRLYSSLLNVWMIVVFTNLFLAGFNLLPIPPLDGSKILAGLLPPHLGEKLLSVPVLQGFIVIGLLLYSGLLRRLLEPVFDFGHLLLRTLSPGILTT